MKVLIIDNFDSFTYNLYHIANQFSDRCDVVRSTNLFEVDILGYDKIIVSPGPSLPSSHPVIFDFLEKYSTKRSILGICLGHQAIAEYFGANLRNMKNVRHGIISKNNIILDDPIFNGIPNMFVIGHYHSWVVDQHSIPSSICITSRNEDGLIMSFRHQELDVCGIQFHPESILTKYGKKIIENWITV